MVARVLVGGKGGGWSVFGAQIFTMEHNRIRSRTLSMGWIYACVVSWGIKGGGWSFSFVEGLFWWLVFGYWGLGLGGMARERNAHAMALCSYGSVIHDQPFQEMVSRSVGRAVFSSGSLLAGTMARGPSTRFISVDSQPLVWRIHFDT